MQLIPSLMTRGKKSSLQFAFFPSSLSNSALELHVLLLLLLLLLSRSLHMSKEVTNEKRTL